MSHPLAFYNEIDKKAAATLRQLIGAGLIAPGIVDERSIEDLEPIDLLGFTQCHFFAGFGIWSLAFRLAGWPDTRPVWSMSCPCQPFSAAGKGAGFADERHLWPAAFHLIQHAKAPDVPVYGEQVASPDGIAWLDLVWADMEAADHTFWPFVLASAGFGAPIIRQRTYWVAWPTSGGCGERGHAAFTRQSRHTDSGLSTALRLACAEGERGWTGLCDYEQSHIGRHVPADSGRSLGLVGSTEPRLEGHAGNGDGEAGRQVEAGHVAASGNSCGLDRTGSIGRAQSGQWHHQEDERIEPVTTRQADSDQRPGPTNGFWRNADWLGCRDERWRPVESGTFPLAHGYPERVGVLRGAGNAISPQVAAEFIVASEEGLMHA